MVSRQSRIPDDNTANQIMSGGDGTSGSSDIGRSGGEGTDAFGSASSPSARDRQGDASDGGVDAGLLQMMREMGFGGEEAAAALQRSGGDMERAIAILAGEDEGPRTPMPEGREEQVATLVSSFGVDKHTAERALDAAALSLRRRGGSRVATIMEVAADFVFEPDEVSYILEQRAERAAGVTQRSQFGDAMPSSSDVSVPFECRCGFTCGTQAAWQRHEDRRRSYGSCEKAAEVNKQWHERTEERRRGQLRQTIGPQPGLYHSSEFYH